jgi:NAD(P)-dependent dehydrogenase (short-subunit alcohol dehydrogenase family)
MAVNAKGVWLGCKFAIAQMLKQEDTGGETSRGKIINIASIGGLVGLAAEPAYCASKGAVVNLTRQLAVDYAPEQTNINAICPGFLATAMVRPFLDDPELNKTVHDLSPWPHLRTAEVFRDPRTDDRERGQVGRVPRLPRRRDGDRIYAGARWRLHRGVRGRSSAGLDHWGGEAHTPLARRSGGETVAFLRPKGVLA